MKKLIVFSLLLIIAGCVQDQQAVLIQDRLDSLSAKVESIERRVRVLENEIKATNTQEAESLYTYIKSLESEIYSLRGDLDSTNQALLELQRKVDDLQFQLAQLVKRVGATSENATSGELQPPKIVTPEELYTQALNLYQSGKYEEALKLFQEFLNKYPSHSLASNAFYWVGECYYGLGRYKDAILQFEDLRRKYPDSSKIPASMLKEAKAFVQLKDTGGAKIILRNLIRLYPRSREAKLARKMLKNLK